MQIAWLVIIREFLSTVLKIIRSVVQISGDVVADIEHCEIPFQHLDLWNIAPWTLALYVGIKFYHLKDAANESPKHGSIKHTIFNSVSFCIYVFWNVQKRKAFK